MEPKQPSPIVARIERDAGADGLFALLSERLAGTDLQSLLLEVLRARSGGRTPAQLLAQAGRDVTVAPAPVDARRLHAVAGWALAAAEGFEAVALSPVAPLGLNAVLGGIDQNNALGTVRGSEVLADPTSALALEAAARRRAGADVVRLCAVERVLRLQPVPAGWSRHFGIFCLVTAARASAGHGVELAALREHVAALLGLLDAARAAGADVAEVAVLVCDPREALVEEHVFAPLRGRHAGVRFAFDQERERARGYYAGLLLELLVTTAAGDRISLADGGLTDWTQRLLSDRKERLFTSGLGIELLVARLWSAQP